MIDIGGESAAVFYFFHGGVALGVAPLLPFADPTRRICSFALSIARSDMCMLATVVTCALAPRRPLPAVRMPAVRMSSPSPSSTADTVSKLLALVEPTDRGIAASDSTRAEASSLISALEESWAGTDAFASPYLLRNTEVVYVGQSSSKG